MSCLHKGIQWSHGGEGVGRHLVAAIDIEAGCTLLIEKPLLITPHWDRDQLKCANCHEDSCTICKLCQFFPLCISCEGHDEFACKFFQNIGKSSIDKNFLLQNFSTYGILRLLLHLEEGQISKDDMKCLLESLGSYCDGKRYQEHEELVVQPILKSNEFLLQFEKASQVQKEEGLSDCDFLHRLCRAIDVNSFELYSKLTADSLRGVYVTAARLPHHCVPNTALSIDDEYTLKVYATVVIKAGETLHNSYTNPLMSTSQRRHHLLLTRQLFCECSRCQDPFELGTHLSSLKCTRCSPGFLVRSTSEHKTVWSCLNCDVSVSGQSVDKLIATAAKDILTVTPTDRQQCEELLCKYASVFHPNHFMMLELKQKLANILRALTLNPLHEVSKELLERRLQLCEYFLPIVRAVIPGYSKLYALALYEYLMAFSEMAELEFRSTFITKDIYQMRMRRAYEIVQDIKEMMKYEPLNSPVGQLMRRLTLQQEEFAEQMA